MPYHAEQSANFFAELAVHDSREAIKRTLAEAEEQLGLELDYRSDPTDERPLRAVGDNSPRRANGMTCIPLCFTDGRVFGELCARGELSDRDLAFMKVLARFVADQLEAEEHELERRRLHAESMGVQALLAAIDARDGYTGDHSKSVVKLSSRVARELKLSTRQVAEAEQVALLHDVGKVAVPDHVLQKPGPLDEHERDLIKTHTVVGARIVRSIAGLAHLAPAIRAGHERWDGRGYPDGLAGEEIPVISRITFACDAYDAMTTDRPYRRALGREHALAELRDNKGTQFCEKAVNALMTVV